MMEEVSHKLRRASDSLSGPSHFRETTELSTQLRHYLDVSERLEKKGLVPKYFVQDPR